MSLWRRRTPLPRAGAVRTIQPTERQAMSEDVRIATITITHDLTDERGIINVTAADSSGDDLPLVEALGLLRFAEDSVIRDRMGETP